MVVGDTFAEFVVCVLDLLVDVFAPNFESLETTLRLGKSAKDYASNSDLWTLNNLRSSSSICTEELKHVLPLLLEPFASVYHGKLIIVFPESHEKKFDILPLMRFLHEAPNVEIEVSTAGN
jgi:hypothetical protein